MKRSGKTRFPEIGMVGVVVKDADKTIKYLSSLGIGPFIPYHREPIIARERGGKPANYKVKEMFALLGQVELQLTEPVEGECIQREFLESKGEGIHHLSFFVDDIDKEVKKLAKKGITVTQRGRRANGGGFVYLDTDKFCGIIVELIQV